MSEDVRNFKDALEYELFALNQSLKAIYNLKNKDPADTTKEKHKAWLKREELKILIKIQRVGDTLKSYKN